MSNFKLNIKGQLNSIKLESSKALWPVYEAIINSIQAVEDAGDIKKGEITIHVKREEVKQQSLVENDTLGRISSFIIEDNGIGMNSANYDSFNTAYSTLKATKGCKGIGRFLWLKTFKSIKIESNFREDNIFFTRKFTFSADGISPDNNKSQIDDCKVGTKIILENILEKYQKNLPVELEVLAKRIVEHCLIFFITEDVPKIIIIDENERIDLNAYYRDNFKSSFKKDTFEISDNKFNLYHLQLPSGVSAHKLHFCANLQEVKSIDLKKYIPNLQRKINSGDEEFYYVGYVTSSYLDSIVNVTRTAFEYDEDEDELEQSLFEKITENDILFNAIVHIKEYLGSYLDEINEEKRQEIDKFVAYERPTYRYLLNRKPEVYDEIPAYLKGEALEMELHKQAQKWERELKEHARKIESAINDNKDYRKLFDEYWDGLTDISKTSLAEYVTRRKTILSILEKLLTVKKNVNFAYEKAVHSIICPMIQSSDTVEFEEMNLWIIDERLAFHKYLASDKTLKSIPVIDSRSTKEPDIAVFDQAFAYSDSDEPLSSITIIEFKKPDNDTKNPIDQVLGYIDKIRDGKKKKSNGQSFIVNDGTAFRCYIVCDISDRMKTFCKNSDLLPTTDNLGFTGYNKSRQAYIEVISYHKLLADAKRRNQIFFDKLFSPKVDEILHS